MWIKTSLGKFKVMNKLSTKKFGLLQLRKVCFIDALKCYYYLCINSHLLYGILRWGNCTNAKCVLVCQKRIICMILGLKSRDSCRNVFTRSGIQLVYNRVTFFKSLARIRKIYPIGQYHF